MKETFLGLGIFVIVIFTFTSSTSSELDECFTTDGNQVCAKSQPESVMDIVLPFNQASIQITNHELVPVFVPMKTEAEFAAFLCATNVGAEPYNWESCGGIYLPPDPILAAL